MNKLNYRHILSVPAVKYCGQIRKYATNLEG